MKAAGTSEGNQGVAHCASQIVQRLSIEITCPPKNRDQVDQIKTSPLNSTYRNCAV